MTSSEKQNTIDREGFSHQKYQQLIASLGARGLIDPTRLENQLTIEGATYSVIGPDTRIDHGAYIDIGGKSAIIVDFENDKKLADTYRLLLPAIELIRDPYTRQEGLTGLTSIVAKLLPYDGAKVTNTYRLDYADQRPLVPRQLGEFIDMRTGICLQQALLTAAILDHAIDSGTLPEPSRASLQSSHDKANGEFHAFTIFRTDTEDWRLDPTQRRNRRAIRM